MSEWTPEDEALVRSARDGNQPTADDHARVKRKLSARIGIGVAAATSALSSSGGASAGLGAAGAGAGAAGGTSVLGTAAKIVGVVALVGASAASVWGVRGGSQGHHAGVAPQAVDAMGSSRSEPSEPPGARGAMPLEREVPAPAVVAASSPSVPASEPIVNPPPPRALLHPTPVASDRLASQSPAPTVTPRPAIVPTGTGLASAPGAADAPAATANENAGPATLSAEADLLRSADAAARGGNALAALALLDRHRAIFPNGTLVEEREAERIVVLCALGRTDEARVAASVFLRNRPRSPLAGRVRASCGGR
jgi:hypothetical protein